MFNFLQDVGPTELIVVVLLLAILFGGKTIAKKLARTSGKAAKDVREVKKEFMAALEEDDKPKKKS